MNNYKSLQEAAKGILCEAVSIAREEEPDFLVIGGWSPFLLNNTDIRHPGTKDVDLLFRHGHNQGELQPVIDAFLKSGYLSSAKHPFQLLRTAKVRGVDFVFNVDFLHNAPDQKDFDLFVDHLDLEDEDEEMVWYQYQSIAIPMSKILFEETSFSLIQLEAVTPNGNECSFEISLMNELGTLITKTKSMENAKRQRDSFDIMLAILQARNRDSLSANIRDLNLSSRLMSLRKITEDFKYRENISKYYSNVLKQDEWSKCAQELNDFFNDSSIPPSA